MLSSTSNLASIKAVSNGSNDVAIRFIPLSSGSGSEAARIDASGRLLVGTSNSRGNFFNGSSGFDTAFQIEKAGYATASIVRNSNNTAAPQFILGKTRGTSNGTNTIVSSGDVIGEISFQAADGAQLVQAAGIEAEVDGTPGSDDMPGRLVFSTTADGASSPTERLRIDNAGRLMLGTSTTRAGGLGIAKGYSSSSPAVPAAGTATSSLLVGNDDGGMYGLAMGANGSGNGYIQAQRSDGNTTVYDLFLQPNGGKVSIGTTAANAQLNVYGGASAALFQNSNTGNGSADGFFVGNWGGMSGSVWNYENDIINFGTNNTERARLDSTGRVLIGTTTAPSVGSFAQTAKLVSQGNTTESVGGAVLSLQRGEAATAITSGEYLGNICFTDSAGSEFARIDGVADDAAGSGDYPGRLVFLTTANSASSPTEKYIIESDGEQRMFSTNTSYTLVLNNGTSAGTSYLLLEGRHSATSNTGQTGTRSLSITTNGNIFNTNNSYGQISDVKLKENIVNASSQWDDIKGVQVRNFNFKEETGHPTHTQIGVVAQELETVSPGLVYDTPDVDADRNDLGTVTKTVNYSVLYMKAVKALQEAMDRIETLEAKVAALEAE
jgi:hypothetical protein